MKKTMLLALAAMLAFGGAALAAEGKAPAASADKKMYVALALDIMAPPTISVNGVSATDNDAVGGGMNIMFNYNVWDYIGVGADFDLDGFKAPKGAKSPARISVMPTVKGFYNFAPQGVPDLEIYGRLGLGYAAIVDRTKGAKNQNTFALKFMTGVAYDILNSGFFVLGELGVNHSTYKDGVTCQWDAFTFGLGAGYRF